MAEFKEWFLNNTEWLYTIIWQTDFFFFDFWSFVHFWSGAFLILIFIAYNLNIKWIILSIILFAYEVFEIIIKYFVFNIFKPETFADQFTDFFVGLAGAISAYYLIVYVSSKVKSLSNNKLEFVFTSVIAALTIAFLWVGFYDYTNEFIPGNFINFNYLTFVIFLLIIFLIQLFYWKLKPKMSNKSFVFIIIWILSLLLLISLEAISHKLFSANLISRMDENPIILDFIKGNATLKTFYLTISFWVIGLYELFMFLYCKAEKNIIQNIAANKL